jgi:hypothetical protein
VDPTDLLKLLVEPRRLAVAGALAAAEGPITSADLARRASVGRREVLDVVAALVAGGLAHRTDDGRYALHPPAWRSVAARVATVTPPPAPTIGHGMTADERVVLGRFFEGTTLREIPATRSSRLVVLERLALEFDPGVRYPERDVNEMLGRFHPDWSSLRRHLVDEGLLDREANVYWRAGGRVLV